MIEFQKKGNNSMERRVNMDKDNVVNGNMANTMEELKQLGKQMENMRDNKQLEEDGRVSDPQQFDSDEEAKQRD